MLTYPEIDPIIFSIGFLKIRWYGLMYVIGFLLAWWLAKRRCRRSDAPINSEQVDDLVFYAMLGVIIGGRVGYALVYSTGQLFSDPLYLFRITEGGMSFHGGLAGVLIAMWLYGRKLRHHIWTMTDFVAPLVPLGLGFGRIGNFINGELWGKPSGLPWAMQVRCDDTWNRIALCERKLDLPPEVAMTPPLHPSMLYEALLEGLVLFVILWWYSAKPRPFMAVSGMFLLFYGLFRFAIEFVRLPDEQPGYIALGWVTMGQVLSLPMIIAGAVMLLLAYGAAGKAAARA
jgi:phosphatidylglycerol:prolipoprotein diacylglycerol transferase